MLILNPPTVRFDDLAWDDVAAIAIERAPQRLVEEWTDAGPFAALVDVPEQRITIKLIRRLARDDLAVPIPGRAGPLSFTIAPLAADSAARRILLPRCVVASVKYDLAPAAGRTTQSITLIAHSKDGDDEPILFPAGDE